MFLIVLNYHGRKDLTKFKPYFFLIGLAHRKFVRDKNLCRNNICWIDLKEYATSKYSM